jgi:hypothetical protein
MAFEDKTRTLPGNFEKKITHERGDVPRKKVFLNHIAA